MDEPILTEKNDRFVIFPVDPEYKDLWDLYKVHEELFWKAEEIDYVADQKEWSNLDSDTKHFLEYVLAFFAGSDGLVLENLVANFASEVKISEARAFYSFQAMIENVHSLCYALLIDSFVKNPEKRDLLFNAIDTIPVVAMKAEWALKWIKNPSKPFAIRLIAFAVIEGIFFSGSFASIFWLKDKGLLVKTLGHSNELIARDESLHTMFAVALFHHLLNKPSQDEVHELIHEAVGLEINFICEAIPCDMIGMNKKLMSEYIRFVADRLLTQLGYDKIWNSENPFPFMDKIGLDTKSNFHEKRVSEYKVGTKKEKVSDTSFNISEDF